MRRAACWLAGAWAGLIAGVGFVAAPALFATLPRGDAGRVAAQLFKVDATIGVCVGAVLLVLCLQLARVDSASGVSSRFSTEMLLVLGALFAIVAGHYAIQPMIESARRGEGGPSFAVLHGERRPALATPSRLDHRLDGVVTGDDGEERAQHEQHLGAEA